MTGSDAADRAADRTAESNADRLGLLMVGAGGALATTVAAGLAAAARNLVPLRGLLTESPECRGCDLAPLGGLVLGGWDLRSASLYEDARRHGVVRTDILDGVKDDLERVDLMVGTLVGTTNRIRTLADAAVYAGDDAETPRRAVDKFIGDIDAFRRRHRLDRVIVVNLASTEPPPGGTAALDSLDAFETALDAGDPGIAAGMLYAYAALRSGCPYVNFTPSTTAEIGALRELARQSRVPVAGKDGKTGQTLYKTALAPMLRVRQLRLTGWYSTNILGNDDGLVLDDPRHQAQKIGTKAGVLAKIMGYDDFVHRVRIDYYPPRGDRKEAWDAIDFEGWLGERMSMRVNWQGIDSVLAAPLVLDLARLIDLAHRRGAVGPVPELALFFKAPYDTDIHDLFEQYAVFRRYLERTLSPVQRDGDGTAGGNRP